MTSTTGPVLVLGATGGQGGAVAAALLRAGRPVRALVRDPASPRARQLSAAGAQLAAGDFTDHDALVAGMRAISAVFALTTPFEAGVAAEVVQGNAIIAAAAAARVPHLVFSSVAGATADTRNRTRPTAVTGLLRTTHQAATATAGEPATGGNSPRCSSTASRAARRRCR